MIVRFYTTVLFPNSLERVQREYTRTGIPLFHADGAFRSIVKGERTPIALFFASFHPNSLHSRLEYYRRRKSARDPFPWI
jgi:hypothetical protein